MGVVLGQRATATGGGASDEQRSRHHVTPRQADILALIADGRADKEIAYQLGISHRTVRTHIERLFRTYGWRSRAQAASTWMAMRARSMGNRESDDHRSPSRGAEYVRTALSTLPENPRSYL